MGLFEKIWSSPVIVSFRRKKQMEETPPESRLNRCLTTFDLTTLGIGSTLGLGIYVLSGEVAASKAGPSIILSFLVAAIASIFAGLCYAEFGARVPKAGSAYIYSYITVGEFMAFIIGWNLVLEYLIGTASVARGYSGYVDQLAKEFGWSFSTWFRSTMPMNVAHLSPYPDFLAFSLCILLSIMLAVGVKESTRFNSIFTILNITVVVYVVVVGVFAINTHYWALTYDEVPHEVATKENPRAKNGGNGGFFPFGVSGMMSGAATCFYGFVGFDAIATTAEEAKNPQKSIPIAITLSLLIVFLAYFSISAIQTLIYPYWDQYNDAPLPYIFQNVGYPVARWTTAVGALFGLSTSLLGAMFPLPRILYAMASDGLIYRFLANVHPRFKTPVLATLLSGLAAAFLSALFDIKQLADMMSIGTLMAYSLVATSVVILRYSVDPTDQLNATRDFRFTDGESCNVQEIISRMFNTNQASVPTVKTTNTSLALITLTSLLIVVMDAILAFFQDQLQESNSIATTFLCIVVLMIVTMIYALSKQPQSTAKYFFKVPLVPWTPMLSIAINMNLIMRLEEPTWVRFAVWMAIGFLVYGTYRIFNSTGYMTEQQKQNYMQAKVQSRVSSETNINRQPDNSDGVTEQPPIIFQNLANHITWRLPII